MRWVLRENQTLKEMITGILFSWVAAVVILFIFLSRPVYYAIGLTIGTAGAVFMAVHMAWSIEDAVLLNEKDAVSYTRKMTYIRYGVACILVIVVGVTDLGSPLTAVLGLMLLKLGAYMQPLFHKVICKKENNFTKDENKDIIAEIHSNPDLNPDSNEEELK